jgi:hypothetical protein
VRSSKGHLSRLSRPVYLCGAILRRPKSLVNDAASLPWGARVSCSPNLTQVDNTTRGGAAELALGSAKGLSRRLLRSAAIEAMIHAIRFALAFAAQAQTRWADSEARLWHVTFVSNLIMR